MWKHILFFISAVFIGFILVYFFWPNNNQLPNLGEIESFSMETVHDETYKLDNNKVKLVAFFYTNCPDICPLTMTYYADIQTELKEDKTFGKDVELVSITMDPTVDTKQVIKNYAVNFNADPTGWNWIRGNEEKTKEVADEFKMMYTKSKDGFIAHNLTVYLLDSNNTIRGMYDMATSKTPMDVDKILKDIDTLVHK